MIKTGTDFAGVGAFDQALNLLGIKNEKAFVCDMDKFARKSYCANYGTIADFDLANTKEHDSICDNLLKCATQGIEPSPELLIRAETMARRFSFYYPFDVYIRAIPEDTIDLYMTSPPCQAFSIAGKRKGKDDRRGVLFFNSLEFIEKNRPRFFIFENVKGLLSHDKADKDADYGRTFNEWVNYLGGKSVNGNTTIFPYGDAVPYHIYHKVLNAKDFGVPQNRERIFIIGIRDDKDNDFQWPKTKKLTKAIRDVLESYVDEKYFLSEKLLAGFMKHAETHAERGNGFKFQPNNLEREARTITTNSGTRPTDNYIEVGDLEAPARLMIKSNTEKGFEEMTENDTLNFSVPNSQTRRGRVGKGVAQTLDTQCNQAVIDRVVQLNECKESGGKQPYQQNRIYDKDGICPALSAGQESWGGNAINTARIRRLTPRECFRLMGFPDSYIIVVSDSQAYKQAGNSIVREVLAEIIAKLNLHI